MIILRGLCWGKLLILDNLHKSFCFKRFKKSQINKNKFLRMKLDIEQKKKKTGNVKGCDKYAVSIQTSFNSFKQR
jgi:hypothetical protein